MTVYNDVGAEENWELKKKCNGSMTWELKKDGS